MRHTLVLHSPPSPLPPHQARTVLASDFWSPQAPETAMVALQEYHQTLSLRAPTHSSASASAPEPAPAAEAAAAAAAALSRCRQLQQLFGALAVVRRTAECLCTLGVRVAYLYLNHMLEQMPRRV